MYNRYASCMVDAILLLRKVELLEQHFKEVQAENAQLKIENARQAETIKQLHSFRRKRGECVGNTRAGKGTLLMIAVDEHGTPLNDVVAAASVHEGHLAEATVRGIVAHRRGKKRGKQLVPKRVIADKGYDDDGLRARCEDAGIDLIAPYRSNRVHRPFEDRRKLRRYRRRYKVERTNAWLKKFRRVAVRWNKNLAAYKGFVKIACNRRPPRTTANEENDCRAEQKPFSLHRDGTKHFPVD